MRITAETQTETGEKYGRFLEWYDSKKRLHKWAMPVEVLHTEGGKLAGYLHSQGLEVMPSRKVQDKLNLYIATAETGKTIISTDKTGWHGDCYVLPDKSIGYAENEIAFQSAGGNAHKFNVKGTLQEWQENVSKYCRGNSRSLLAVSCAFVAPLLPIVNEQGGGFHFLGDSSLGKSTGLLVAGSVIGGGGKQGAMETWKATINGLEAVAALHNHNLLILDEISEADPRYIGNAVYMLSNGIGKLRMRETLQARQSFIWQLLFMSSGEKTLEQIMAEVGQNIKTGQEVRLAEIPADSGKFGFFEDLHGFPHGSAFSDYLQAQSIKFYGSAFYEYLKFLADFDFQSIREKWYSFRDSFIEQVFLEMEKRGLPGKDKTPSEVLRVAKRFALVAFGGELATQANIWAR